jgi:hypothetical protein
MNTTEARSYCTYCFRYGTFKYVAYQTNIEEWCLLGCYAVKTSNLTDKYSLRKSGTETDRAISWGKQLKHADVNVSENAVLKDICRAGNATCMKRSLPSKMTGSYSNPYIYPLLTYPLVFLFREIIRVVI